MSDGLQAPLGAAQARLLRRAVLDHVRAEPRRVHPPLLHVGRPGGPETVFPADDPGVADHHLRTEVLQAMLRRVGALEEDQAPTPPLIWITRHGPQDLQDVDAVWLATARSATAELGLPLTMVVVDRHGWRDPRSGLERRWRRLRARR